MTKIITLSLFTTLILGSVYLFNLKSPYQQPLQQTQEAVGPNSDIEYFLANWVGELQPVIGELNFFDLSVPGTHDTFTYDLSEIFSDHANSIPTNIAWILHNIVSNLYTFGNFGKTQSVTQTLDIKQQLDSGVRWIDFRAVYTQNGVKSLTSDWYALHFMQSIQKFTELAQQIRDWLDEHDKEIVTIQITYHGDSCNPSGSDYPGITTKQKQQCWSSFEEIFQGILYNSETQKSLNEISISDLLSADTRVIVYVSQWEEFTDSSPYAQDGCQVWQEGHSQITKEDIDLVQEEIDYFKGMKEQRAVAKSEGKYLLRSFASGFDTEILYNFIQRYAPDSLDEYSQIAHQDCIDYYGNIPQNQFCPTILRELSQWTNFYKQISLNIVREQNYEFPNAIFVDQIDSEGTIRTGTKVLEEASEFYGGKNPEDARFAYSSIIIRANLNYACDVDHPSTQCQQLYDILQENIDKYGEYRWNDNNYGRQKEWPL